jgi:hypothetical protein
MDSLLPRKHTSTVQQYVDWRCLGEQLAFRGAPGYKPEGGGYLILPAALGPGVHSASNRNEYQKQRNKYFWGVERGR